MLPDELRRYLMREDSILENILNQLRHLSLQDLLVLQGAVNVLVLVLTDIENKRKANEKESSS